MDSKALKSYKRDCLLGALGAFFMLVGDLCLSVIPASPGDSGLFVREAYLDDSYEAWRLPLLLAAGLVGMSLGFFTVRASYLQIQPQYRKPRSLLLAGGVVYIATAGTLHFFIGSLADRTGTLALLVEREKAIALIQADYVRLMPARKARGAERSATKKQRRLSAISTMIFRLRIRMPQCTAELSPVQSCLTA